MYRNLVTSAVDVATWCCNLKYQLIGELPIINNKPDSVVKEYRKVVNVKDFSGGHIINTQIERIRD
ncbi:hypothetical protein PIROE2DRAFT_10139 [Piromyces sp. E2]|nr:hypothetical protein PIROE2DRAFT_10139 [Piromyces sp. E2]|eukprot:OUM63353.1 hypothetical protein PIROE2DRAFT_10139 [Piromyces sp. E2]